VRILRFIRWAAVLVAMPALLLGIFGASSASAASSGIGWVRLAHFSPNTPACDVYLYSFGDSSAEIVLHHVAYGTASPYESLSAGDYTVAMRPAGAAPTSAPAISTTLTVVTGHSYTVAGLGPASGLRLAVLDDQLTTPPGKALVRVIQASLQEHIVSVSYGGKPLVHNLAFGSVASYQTVDPGTAMVMATGPGEATGVKLAVSPGTVHTLVILDGAQGLEIDNLVDAAGSGVAPAGGAATGLGGTAPRVPSPAPWLLLVTAGILVAGGGGIGLRWLPRSQR
jgi:hypothetical protein